jgi:uronate dehydrogenase
MRVGLTGAGGKLGSLLRTYLVNNNYQLHSLSFSSPITALAMNEKTFQGDLATDPVLGGFYNGLDVIVHMAGSSVEKPLPEIIHNNLIGLNSLYEQALAHGVKRIIFASSNHAIGMHTNKTKLGLECSFRPDGYYGLSKMWGEGLARLYYDKCGIESVCLRIGSVEERPSNVRHLSTWLSQSDFLHLVEQSILAPIVDFQVIWGVSNNTRSYWSNAGAESIAFEPKDNAEDFSKDILKKHEANNLDTYALQGGSFSTAKFPVYE